MATENEQVKVDLTSDPDKALAGIKKFYTGFQKRHEEAEKSFRKLDNEVAKFFTRFKNSRRTEADIKALQAQYDALGKSLKAVDDQIADIQEKAKGQSEEMQKAAREQIKQIKAAHKYNEALKERKSLKESIKTGEESVDFKDLQEQAERAGQALVSPLDHFAQRDAPALFGHAIKFALKANSKVSSWGGALGGAMAKKGEQLKARGFEESGGALKMLGGGLGKVSEMLTKLGPLIQLGSTFLMSFVKVLLDSEAAAKEFNKQILSSAGTSEFFRSSFDDATGAQGKLIESTEKLEDTLRDARDGATAWSNIQWGISKDMAGGFIASLTAEGVSLKRLGKEMDNAGGHAQDYAKTIQMGVAYSRAFGVSLNEISQMQGQLMADVGMGLDSVEASFERISDGAADAGMATNKFFSIISSFSADLSLFALRMEDVTTMMGKLGKTMDPREAQRFLQGMAGKFSGGVGDNLKHVVIAGTGKVQNIAKASLAGKKEGLRQELANKGNKKTDIDALMKILDSPKRDPKAIAEWQSKHTDKLNGSIVSAIYDTANMTEKVMSGDAADLASIIDQLDPLGKMAVTNEESKKLFGSGLKDLKGAQLLAAESALGVSQQEIREFQKLDGAILSSQDELLDRMKTGNVTQDDIAQLARMNLTWQKTSDRETTADQAKDNASMTKKLEEQLAADEDHTKFWSSLSKTQKALLEGSSKEISAQQQTANFQTSTLDKLQIIADILMNEIYDALTDVLEGVTKIWGRFFGGNTGYTEGKVAARKTHNRDIAEVWQKHAGEGADADKNARTDVIDTVGKKAIDRINAASDEYEKLQESVKTETDPNKKGEAEARMKELKAAHDMVVTKGRKLNKQDFYESSDQFHGGKAKQHSTDVGLQFYRSSQEVIEYAAQLARATEGVKDLDKAAEKKADEQGKEKPAAAVTGPTKPEQPRASTPAASGTTAVGGELTGAASAAAPAAPAAAVAGKPDDAQKAVVETQQATTSSVEHVNRNVQASVKATEDLRDKMANSVYEGAAKALFEYYMYSGMDKQKVAYGLSKGGDARALRQSVTSGEFPDVGLAKWLNAQKDQPVQAHAMGGIVTGISGNLAQTKRLPPAAPGEGWASVGKGERILPAGAGGGGGNAVRVELSLRGDLKQFIDARVVDGAVKHERNKRMR